MTSIILAGGRSSRFGCSKAFEPVGGKSLIQWVIDRLTLLSKEILIVTAESGNFAYSPSPMTKRVVDIYPGKGPLGGIYSGLVTSSCSRAIVVACDMPFLSVALLDYMAQFSPASDVVVPRIKELVEPLCAIYSKNCLVPIQRLLERDELGIRELFKTVRVRYVEQEDIDQFDPEHLSFFNVNTKADLDKARRLAFPKGLASGKHQRFES
jgi:molybdopterin-guanine dinucleotide biosynthesis protein A